MHAHQNRGKLTMNLASLKGINPNGDFGKAKPVKKPQSTCKGPPAQETIDLVTNYLKKNGEVSRQLLVCGTGLNVTTISRVVKILLNDNLASKRKVGLKMFYKLVK